MYNSTRRTFIKQSAILSTGFLLAKDEYFKTPRKVGVQLYTLRDQLGKDLEGVIAAVAAAGYQEVETFNYNNRKHSGLSVKDFDALLKKNQLQTPSGHYGLRAFIFEGKDDVWKWAIEDAKAIGQKYMVIPWLAAEDRKNLDAYKKVAARLNRGGELCKEAGMQIAYHNHDFEFIPMEGSTGMDVLLKETDKSLVQFEMDIYWVSFAGRDPIELIKKNPGRFPLWHVKDMDNTNEKRFTEVGNGVINFDKIFDCQKKAGLKHFFVEQDVSKNPLESIKTSIGYLKKEIL